MVIYFVIIWIHLDIVRNKSLSAASLIKSYFYFCIPDRSLNFKYKCMLNQGRQ